MGEAKSRGSLEERVAQATNGHAHAPPLGQPLEGSLQVRVLKQAVRATTSEEEGITGVKFLLEVETQAYNVTRAEGEERPVEEVVESRAWATGLTANEPEQVARAMQQVMVRALASGMIAIGAIDPLELAVQFLIKQRAVQFARKPKLLVPDRNLVLPPSANG